MPKKQNRNPAILLPALSAGTKIASLAISKAAQSAARTIRPPRARPPRQRMTRSAAPMPVGAVSRAQAPPVALGFRIEGPKYSFSAAPNRNGSVGLRVTTRQLWATVSVTNGSAAPLQNISGTANLSYLTFDPDDTKTMPEPLTSFAQVFSRYCLRQARVEYVPAAGTSTGGALGLAVNTDPTLFKTTLANPTFIELMEQARAISLPLWMAGGIDVPCDDTLRFMNQTTTDAVITPAEERQDHAFVLGAQFNASSAATTGTVEGYIFLTYVIDLYEVMASLNETSLLRRVAALRERRERRIEQSGHGIQLVTVAPAKESKEEKKQLPLAVSDDDYVGLTPPPSARGLSSIQPVTLSRPAGRTASAKA